MTLAHVGTSVRVSTLELRRRSVLRAVEAMRETLEQTTTLAAVAGYASMSRFHFNRVFREITGVPPIRFLFALRIQRAKELLLTTDQRVIDVCYEVGYSSLGSFGNAFHRQVGLTPRDFRRMGCELRKGWLRLPRGEPQYEAAHEGLRGRVVSSEPIDGPVFIGFFPSQAPLELPVACAMRVGAGPFQVPYLPDGRYAVLATATAWSDGPTALCLQDRGWRGAGSPVIVRRGEPLTPVRVAMRRALLTDPPVLPSPAVLFSAAHWQDADSRLESASPKAFPVPVAPTIVDDEARQDPPRGSCRRPPG